MTKHTTLTARELSLAALFAALMATSARLSVPLPFYPAAPFSLQTLVVLLAGLLLPPRSAFAAMATYLLVGLCGLPIFAQGGGLWYVLQPSFGYLVGFVVAAPLVAQMTRGADPSWHRLAMACAAGTLAISVCGIVYLALVVNILLPHPFGLRDLASMFVVTLPLDTVKLALAIAIALPLRRRLARSSHSVP